MSGNDIQIVESHDEIVRLYVKLLLIKLLFASSVLNRWLDFKHSKLINFVLRLKVMFWMKASTFVRFMCCNVSLSLNTWPRFGKLKRCAPETLWKQQRKTAMSCHVMSCLVMRDTRLWKYGDRFREEEAYPGSKYCETQHCNRSVTFSFLCHDSSLSSSSPTTTSHAS